MRVACLASGAARHLFGSEKSLLIFICDHIAETDQDQFIRESLCGVPLAILETVALY